MVFPSISQRSRDVGRGGVSSALLQGMDIGQAAVQAAEVEAVTDHEAVGYREPDIVQGHIDLPELDLVEDDVPALDGHREVRGQAHDSRRARFRAVGRHAHEVDADGRRDGADEIGHEYGRALEHPDQERDAATVLAADGAAELAHASGDLGARDEHATGFLRHGSYFGATKAAMERSTRIRSAIRWASGLLLKVPTRTR